MVVHLPINQEKAGSLVNLKPIRVIDGNSFSYSDKSASMSKSGLQNADNKYPIETENEKTRSIILTTNCGFSKPKYLAQPTIGWTDLTDAEKQTLHKATIDRQKNIEAIEKEIARARNKLTIMPSDNKDP